MRGVPPVRRRDMCWGKGEGQRRENDKSRGKAMGSGRGRGRTRGRSLGRRGRRGRGGAQQEGGSRMRNEESASPSKLRSTLPI